MSTTLPTSPPSRPVTAGAGPRILILDNVITNMGDAAILLAMKSSLEEAFGPGAEVRNCYCGLSADPGVFRDLYPELHFVPTLWNAWFDGTLPKWNLLGHFLRLSAQVRFPLQARLKRWLPNFLLSPQESRLLKEYEEADVIVVTGGAALSTSWTPPRLRRLRIAEYETALILGKPLVFYAQSFGPFVAGDPMPALLKPILERASVVLCRDGDSLRVVREQIGLTGGPVYQTIDEALLLTPRPPTFTPVPARRKPVRVGLCLHKWHWLGEDSPAAKQSAFEARMAQVCRTLLERGDAELVLITTHQKTTTHVHTDVDVIERVFSQIPESLRGDVQLVSEFIHPQEFAGLMGGCDLVVSSRLHGAILSLAGGAPTVALEYEPKTRGLMRQIGLEDWVLSMGDSSAEEISAKAAGLLADGSETKRRLSEAMTLARGLALKNRELTVQAVRGAAAARA